MDSRVIKYTLSVLLLLSTPAWAGNLMMVGGGTPTAGGPTTFPCTNTTTDGESNTVVLCEDFEGAEHCEDRVAAGSVCRLNHEWVASDACATEVLYGTTGAINGTNSAYCDETTGQSLCSKYTAITAADNVYMFGKIKFLDEDIATDSSTIFFRFQNNTSMYCGVGINNVSGTKTFATSDGTNATNCTNCPTPTANTVYYVWLEFLKGTSCTAYVSTSKTKPTSVDNGMVQDTSVSNVQINRVVGVRCNATIFDRLSVDDVIIKTTGSIEDIAE